MRAWFRASWLGVRASYWFIPTILSVLALLAALGLIAMDRAGASTWLTRSGWFEASGPEGARAQLTVIANAAISIASTVFAITIAAVAYASGNYGPRLLTNFMNDRGNQVSLGMFIATFVFNLSILRVVRSEEASDGSFVPQLSVAASAISVVVAVAVLVYFLHHVPASIRINTVLGGIGRRLIADIDRRFPSVDTGAGSTTSAPPGETVTATEFGYIEIIDFRALDEVARAEGLVLTLRARTGDFLHPHLPMADVAPGDGLDDELKRRIRVCFSLGDSRTPAQDLEFLIDELVEIGLRALSPGINDPFTAITSIHWMAAALARLADRSLVAGPEQESYSPERVRPQPDDFGHFLRRSFGGLRASAAANAVAAPIFIHALSGVARGASVAERRQALLEEGERLLAQAQIELSGPALAAVVERVERFRKEAQEAVAA